MDIRKGIGVSPGVAIAKSVLIDSEEYRIPRRSIMSSQRRAEIKRVRDAFQDAVNELAELEAAQSIVEGKIRDIFAVHTSFLRDRSLRKR